MPVRSNVQIKIGPVSATVSIDSAIPTRSSDPTVCLGQPGHTHAPSAIKQPRVCSTCGPIIDATRTAKARKVGSTYHLLPARQVAEISEEVSKVFKDPTFIPSPREQVDAATASGSKVYYLTPQGPAGNYANLRSMIRQHPELAFVGRFTVKSAVSIFTLEVRGDALVLVERKLLEGLKPLPQVDAEPDAFEQMCVTAVAALTTDFDVAAYTDERTVALAEAYAASEDVADLSVDGASAPAPAVELDAMELELQRLIDSQKAKDTPARKAAKKAVAAKKAAPKKTATKVA